MYREARARQASLYVFARLSRKQAHVPGYVQSTEYRVQSTEYRVQSVEWGLVVEGNYYGEAIDRVGDAGSSVG